MIKEKMFLENESKLICESLNGVLFELSVEAGVHNQQLIKEIEDGIKLNKLDIKWEVDGEKLIEKLKSLSQDESFEIIEEVYKYWERDTTEICNLKLRRKEIDEFNIYKIPVSKIMETDEALQQFPVEVRQCDNKYKTNQMVISLNRLYQNQKREIKGMFTLSEAYLLISIFNGCMYTPWNNDKEVLLMMLEDGTSYEGLDELYDVDSEKMFEKLQKLNEFESFTVIRMAFEFWERNSILGGEELLKEIFGIE
jgi:hypothetical protein